MSKLFSENLIAPCGMNCGICEAYLREQKKCPGCFTGRKVNKRPIRCGRKLCKKRYGKFCFQCDSFPCDSIKRLDERYQKSYDMSEIANLKFIKENGIEKFLKQQEKKYSCHDGKGTICVHNKKCYIKK